MWKSRNEFGFVYERNIREPKAQLVDIKLNIMNEYLGGIKIFRW